MTVLVANLLIRDVPICIFGYREPPEAAQR